MHFENEETFLQSCGMSDTEVAEHVAAHSDILDQYAELTFGFMDGQTLSRSEMVLMIKRWILEHLVRYDLKIRKYLAGAV
jgi:hemerythrin